MNKSQQVEFCIRTAIFLKREAGAAICFRDDIVAIRSVARLMDETEQKCEAVRLKILLASGDDASLDVARKKLIELKDVLQRMVAAAWPNGDERAQVALLYLRLYCVMLENPETLSAL